MKVLLCLLISCVLAVSPLLSTGSVQMEQDEPQTYGVDMELDQAGARENADGTVTYTILNVEELATAWGLDADKVKEMTYTSTVQAGEEFPTPRATILVDNVTGPRSACGIQKICECAATNASGHTVTQTITLEGSVSNTYTTSVESGVSVEVATISAAVGFDVTASWTMTVSAELELEPGESATVMAFPLYDLYQFDVYKKSFWGTVTEVGSGIAYHTVGFCTVVSDE